MSNVSVQIPPLGVECLFSFKRPFNAYVNTTLQLNTDTVKLKVISIVSMRDMIAIEKVDAFVKYYVPVGIPESDFKVDLDNDTPILTLLYGEMNVVKVPLSYISSYRGISQIQYSNKVVVMDLGVLPVGVSVDIYFEDLKSYMETRVGVRPEVREVNLGSQIIPTVEHDSREAIRAAVISIHDTNETRLQKMTTAYNELLGRFNAYRISHP